MRTNFLTILIRKFFLIGIAVCCLIGFSGKVFAQASSDGQRDGSANLPLVAVTQFEIKPEQRDLFLKLATAAIEPTHSEPGCITYALYEQPTVKNSFMLYEEWKDQAALDEHVQKPYVQEFGEKMPQIVKGSGVTKIYKTSNVETFKL
jgi:quinol monooxygenase YgiN